jgi:Sec-independent protein translocase protein TatA
VVAFMVGRELAVIVVIALLAAGGSQLPKLVRAFGESSAVPKQQATDPETDAGTSPPGHPSPDA